MMRTGADEARDPKYARIERERRWLVNPALRPDLANLPFTLIEDHYVDGTRMRLRRMTDSVSGEQALKLTKKYECDDPLARPIVTAYLTVEEHALLASMPAIRLSKRRYEVFEGATEFSIDIFFDDLDGLELAEIEWPDDAGLRALTPPVWIIGEVSDDARYQGGNLVKLGKPKD